MTVSRIKLKVVRKSKLKLRLMPRFPAALSASLPLTITSANGCYQFGVDLTSLYASLDVRYVGAVQSIFGRIGNVSAQSGDYTFAQIGSKPTTLAGYGITDAAPLASPTFTGNVVVPSQTRGDNSTKAANTAYVDQTLGSAGSAGSRNRIINGGLEVWQRGTSVSVAASSTAYTADRWYLATGANQASTVAQTTGLNNGSRYAGYAQRNPGQTGTGTMVFAQPLETAEIVPLRGQKVTLSFTAQAGTNFSPTSGTLNYIVYAGTGSEAKRNGSAYTSETTVLSGSVNLTAGGSAQNITVTSAAILPTTTTQLEVQFFWAPTGTAGALDYVILDDVQLESGTVATPFERKTYSTSLLSCSRYYRKDVRVQGMSTTTQVYVGIDFTGMRSTPTVGGSGPLQFFDGAANFVQSSFSVTLIGTAQNGGLYQLNNFTGMTSGRAAIQNNNGNSNYLTLDAEI